MSKQKPKSARFGLFSHLLRIGFIVLSSVVVLEIGYSGASWRADYFPIDLGKRVAVVSKFEAGNTKDYEVGLIVERKLPVDKIVCDLGIEYPGLPSGYALNHTCKGVKSKLNLRWSIYSANGLVGFGSSKIPQYGSFGKEITRTLGVVQLSKGGIYEIHIVSEGGMLDFEPAAPHILIEVSPADLLPEFRIRQLELLVSILVGVVATFFEGYQIFAILWKRRFGCRILGYRGHDT